MDDLFDQIVDRRNTLSVKWNRDSIRSIAGNPDAEPFWVADMDFKAAPQIREEVVKAAEGAIYGYPHFDGTREAFSAFVLLRHGWEVPAEDVVVCQGLLTSIAMMTEMLTQKGDGVIVPMPAYQPFVRIVSNLERKLIPWPMRYENHQFSLDWDLLEKLAKRSKFLIFCSPHNPSGAEFSQEDLERLCAIMGKENGTIISDEIHSDLSFGKHIPLVKVARQSNVRAVTCMAPSKTFNIAGEHFSVVVTYDKEIREGLEKRMGQLFNGEPSFFSTTAAMAAYKSGYPWLMRLLPYLEENIDFIDEYLRRNVPELVFIKPHASFIGFIDCGKILPLVEKDAKAHKELYDPSKSPSGGIMSRFFGQRAAVAVNDGTWFGGDDYRSFVRFNYGVRKAAVQGALEMIKDAVDQLKKTYS